MRWYEPHEEEVKFLCCCFCEEALGLLFLSPSAPQHTDPDYSAAYVVLETDGGLRGFGLTFTLGKGTEIGGKRRR